MKHWLYILFGNYRCVRRFIGGRWVKAKDMYEWLQWNDSILKDYLDWPMDHEKYESEDWG